MPGPETDWDEIDRRILNRIQSDFPTDPRPYLVLGAELGLSEEEMIRRVRRLKAKGLIRRIGGNFVPDRLGYVSTLCAARVPADRLPAFIEAVNRHPGVTHNYLRENAWNVWFTFIAPTMADIEEKLERLRTETGVTEILNLPATRVFKIRAQFDV
ncbi:MAG: AsnC family transcriptional regulator [Desulfobacterales bacterium]